MERSWELGRFGDICSAGLSAFAEATADRRSLGGGWSGPRWRPCRLRASGAPASLAVARSLRRRAKAGKGRPTVISKQSLAVGITALIAVVAHAQTGPPRDRPPPPTGTAIIKGRVIDAQTGIGLARARVRLQGPASNRPPVVTDDTGAFKLTDVPAGSVFIGVDRSGYMSARYPDIGKTIRAI